MCYNSRKREHLARNCRSTRSFQRNQSSSTGYSHGNLLNYNQGRGRGRGYGNNHNQGYNMNQNRDQQPERTEEPAQNMYTAFNVEEVNSSSRKDIWIMDSGASAHMTYKREFFFQENQSSVVLGDGSTLKVLGKGTVNIKKLVNGMWQDGTISDVLYIPNFNKNLSSEGVLIKKKHANLKRWRQSFSIPK